MVKYLKSAQNVLRGLAKPNGGSHSVIKAPKNRKRLLLNTGNCRKALLFALNQAMKNNDDIRLKPLARKISRQRNMVVSNDTKELLISLLRSAYGHKPYDYQLFQRKQILTALAYSIYNWDASRFHKSSFTFINHHDYVTEPIPSNHFYRKQQANISMLYVALSHGYHLNNRYIAFIKSLVRHYNESNHTLVLKSFV